MSLLVEKGTFVKVSSGVSDNQTVSMTGDLANDVIKALILFTTMGGVGNATTALMHVGISDGTTEFAVAGVSEDGVTTSNTGRRHAARALTLMDTTPAMRAECTVTDLATAGEFTLNWSTNDTSIPTIHYFAIGGDDLTDVKVGTFLAQTSTGDQSITGVTFKPDALFFLSAHETAGTPSTSDTNILSFGMAVSDTHEAAVTAGDIDNASSTETGRGGYGSSPATPNAGFCLRFVSNKSGTVDNDGQAEFQSMDADGFTMNWTQAAGALWHTGYLALRGGQYSVDTDASQSGLRQITVGFEPKGVLTINATARNDSGIATNYALGIGAADSGITEGTSSAVSKHDVTTSECDRTQKTDKVSVEIFTGPSIFAEADLNALLNVGYEYDWSAGSARTFTLAMGDARPHAGPALGSAQVGIF